MKKHLLLLCAAASALLFVSCSESTTPNDPIQFANVLILKATINNVVRTPSVMTSDGSESSGNVAFDIGGTIPESASTLNLAATVQNAGTYTLGGATGSGSFSFTDATIVPPSATVYSTGTDAAVTLVVERIDRTLKRVKGRFSGKIRSSTGVEYDVKDGAFEGAW